MEGRWIKKYVVLKSSTGLKKEAVKAVVEHIEKKMKLLHCENWFITMSGVLVMQKDKRFDFKKGLVSLEKTFQLEDPTPLIGDVKNFLDAVKLAYNSINDIEKETFVMGSHTKMQVMSAWSTEDRKKKQKEKKYVRAPEVKKSSKLELQKLESFFAAAEAGIEREAFSHLSEFIKFDHILEWLKLKLFGRQKVQPVVDSVIEQVEDDSLATPPLVIDMSCDE